MRPNFTTGLLAGIALASVLVVGSSYSQGGAAIGLTFLPSFGTQSASATSTITLSSTSQTVTSTSTSTTSSSITQSAASLAIPTTSTVTSTAGAEVSGSSINATQSSIRFAFGPAAQSPSSLAAMVDQPGRIPLLLVPVLAALILAFVIYRVSAQKD